MFRSIDARDDALRVVVAALMDRLTFPLCDRPLSHVYLCHQFTHQSTLTAYQRNDPSQQ